MSNKGLSNRIAAICLTLVPAFGTAGSLLLASGLAGSRAAADATTYTTTRRQVRAAILTSSALNVTGAVGKTVPENPDPHVFFVLDSRTDLKPLGMDFVNPLAPPVITNAIYQRWQDRVRLADPAFQVGTRESQIFRVGAPVTKNIGAYWELNLDTATDTDLRQYDLLYLHSHRQKAIFTPENKEKLRKFIEAGGTLWVENCGLFTFDSQNSFLYDVSMQADYNAAANASAVIANATHPLLSYPFVLNAQDVQNLGDKFRTDPVSGGRFLLSGYYLYAAGTPPVAAPGLPAVNPPGGQTLVPIVWNSLGVAANNPISPPKAWRPMILAGTVGAGRIMFASQDSGCKINDYAGSDRPDNRNAGYGGNSQAVSGEILASASPQDLKLCYNLAAWTGSHQTSQTDTRHTGGTADRIAGSLSEKWPIPVNAGTARVGGATLFKHCIYTVDGSLILHCYDAKPGQDLDGDGNADDGIQDSLFGLPYDEVWNFDLKTISPNAIGASTPTCYEFYDTNFGGATGGLANFPNREQVVVVLSDGKVVALRALPRLAIAGFPLAPIGTGPFSPPNPNGAIVEWVLDTTTVTGLTSYNLASLPPTTQIPAATWSEGVLFVAVNVTNGGNLNGRIVAIHPGSTNGGQALSAFNLLNGTNATYGVDSQVPLQSTTVTPPPAFIGAPTVGYVRDNTSGALDKIIYVETDQLTGSGGQPQSVRAIPFGSKGEQLTRAGGDRFASRSVGTVPPVGWFLVDRANPGNANPELAQRVWATYTDPLGNNFATELTYFVGAPSGIAGYVAVPPPASGTQEMIQITPTITFPANGSVAAPPPVPAGDANLKIFADFTLDWTINPAVTPANANVGVRSVLTAPDINNSGNLIGGPSALAPNDVLYYAVDTTAGAAAGGNNGRGVIFAVNEQSATRSVLKWTYTMHNGFQMTLNNGNTVTVPPRLRQLDKATEIATGATIGTYITDVQFTSTPAFRNGVVYCVARANIGGQPGSLLCAFRAESEFVLHMNTAIDKTQPVIVKQLNVVKQQNGQPSWETISNNQAAPPGVQNASPITVDYDSGTIHINMMSNPGPITNFFSASLPFVVQVGTQEQVIAGTQIDNINGAEDAHMIGAPGVDNLLWYAVIPATSIVNGPFGSPGIVTSSPSVQGDVVFLGTANGFVLAIDADPASTDPAAQAAGAQIQLADNLGKLVHLRWVQRVTSGNTAVLAPPTAFENVLASNTAEGAHAYEDALTVVADSNRLIEVNSAGEAVWTCEGTRSFGGAGGDIAQYVDNGGVIVPSNPATATGVPVVHKIPFARPAVARRINTNDFLVVDTGNNRVVQIDRGGSVIWEVHRLFDDMKTLLRPGDPLSLNEPSDCSYWTEYTPSMNTWFDANLNTGAGVPYAYNNLPGYIIHYLITDTGNFRVVEVVDIYNSSGQPVRPIVNGAQASFTLLRQLFFVSSTYGTDGKQYRYRGVQRALQVNGTLSPPFLDPARPANAIRRFTLAAITNYRLGTGNTNPNGTAAASESGGGSIVVMDETGAPISAVTNLALPAGGNTFKLQPIDNPTSFSKFDVTTANGGTNTTVFHYLLSDANGCYQLRSGLDANNNPVMIVEWMLSNSDYFAMTGKRLNAMSLRRLNTAVVNGPNIGLHHFLIANRFSGGDMIPNVFGISKNVPNGSEFNGEVFEVDPATYNPGGANDGYIPDYSLDPNNFLVANSGGLLPQASIVWRAPSETIPVALANTPANPTGAVLRFIGSASRATTTGVLDKPSYADRPF